PHQDVVDPESRDQSRELLRRKHNAVDIDLLEITRRRLRQVAFRVAARAPGMVDAARISPQKAATVDRDDLDIGVPLEHAVEDEIVQRDRGIERITDDVVEVEARKASRLGEAVGMDEHDCAELLGLLPERRESGVRELFAGYIGENLHAFELERCNAALKLARGFV